MIRSAKAFSVSAVVLGLGLSLGGCKGKPLAPDPNEDLEARIDVVYCGGEDCDLADGEHCCMDGTKRSHCKVGCDLECDGPEDCADGEKCCGDRDGNWCTESCSDYTVCHDHNDCKDNATARTCFESFFVENNYCKR